MAVESCKRSVDGVMPTVHDLTYHEFDQAIECISPEEQSDIIRELEPHILHTFQHIIYDITGGKQLHIISILLGRLISAEICDITGWAEVILNMQYYWISPYM
jgi:hypothetical protein